jgi:hypothetical protein
MKPGGELELTQQSFETNSSHFSRIAPGVDF